MKSKISLILIAVLGFAFVSFSGTAFATKVQGHSVKARQVRQQDRIAQGVKSGELTAKETARLEKGETKIARDRKKALADGTLTQKEKTKLQHEENVESHKIFNAKHNEKEQPKI